MLPVILPGQLYGQNVTVTGVDVYLITTGSSYIDGTYVRRQSGAGSGDLILANLTDRACSSACSYHLALTANNVLYDLMARYTSLLHCTIPMSRTKYKSEGFASRWSMMKESSPSGKTRPRGPIRFAH
jgi:hypothetical protein